MLRLLAIACAVVACHRADAQTHDPATVVGYATLPFALTGPARGTVRLIVRGSAEISDACPDAALRAFVSEYDGELELRPDGSFSARLAPFQPPVATPSGCPA